MKPGHTSTEFWLATLCVLCSIGLAVLGDVPAPWAVAASSVVSILYTVARFALKAQAAQVNLQSLLAEIEADNITRGQLLEPPPPPPRS